MRYFTKPVVSDITIAYHTYTLQEVLDEYFPDWANMMARYNNPITEEACIKDWLVFNNAWESDSEGYHVLPPSASEGSSWC